jgi:hypothetical protein
VDRDQHGRRERGAQQLHEWLRLPIIIIFGL